MTNYITHNRATIDINGTHLMGEIDTSYERLVEVLGKPQEGDGYKVDAEWCLKFNNGLVATIYNYKDGKNYNGSEGLETEAITDWHIGGLDKQVVSLVHKIIAEGIKPDTTN